MPSRYYCVQVNLPGGFGWLDLPSLASLSRKEAEANSMAFSEERGRMSRVIRKPHGWDPQELEPKKEDPDPVTHEDEESDYRGHEDEGSAYRDQEWPVVEPLAPRPQFTGFPATVTYEEPEEPVIEALPSRKHEKKRRREAGVEKRRPTSWDVLIGDSDLD